MVWGVVVFTGIHTRTTPYHLPPPPPLPRCSLDLEDEQQRKQWHKRGEVVFIEAEEDVPMGVYMMQVGFTKKVEVRVWMRAVARANRNPQPTTHDPQPTTHNYTPLTNPLIPPR